MTDPETNVEIESEDSVWMPCAGLERGTVENVNRQNWRPGPDYDQLMRLKMSALGISEEFLVADAPHVPFFDAGFDNRITVSPAHKTYMDETFRRVIKRTMRPGVHCIATRNGAVVFGKRFRSLRLARVWYKNMQDNIKIKFADKPLSPVESWVPVTEYGI